MLRLIVLLITVLTVAASASVFANNVETHDLGGRIVGGKVTDISKHPHQVSMRYKSCNTCAYNHRCGGSIVQKNVIVTAAHCVVGNHKPQQFHIVAGANERNGHGLIYLVKNIFAHEDYQKNTPYANDIAVLILADDLPLNDYDIKAINMTDKRPDSKDISQITGWGTTTEGGYPPDVLLEVEIPIVSNDFCESRYGRGRIDQSMLCAATAKGGKDACQGDSGGPLVVDGFLAGVVSWGNGCARPEYPGVYASVFDLKPWVLKTIAENT